MYNTSDFDRQTLVSDVPSVIARIFYVHITICKSKFTSFDPSSAIFFKQRDFEYTELTKSKYSLLLKAAFHQ